MLEFVNCDFETNLGIYGGVGFVENEGHFRVHNCTVGYNMALMSPIF
jgi:hypothetical protein